MGTLGERLRKLIGQRDEEEVKEATKRAAEAQARREEEAAKLKENRAKIDKAKQIVREADVRSLLMDVKDVWGGGRTWEREDIEWGTYAIGLDKFLARTKLMESYTGQSGDSHWRAGPKVNVSDIISINISNTYISIRDERISLEMEFNIRKSLYEERASFNYSSKEELAVNLENALADLTERRIKKNKLPRDFKK